MRHDQQQLKNKRPETINGVLSQQYHMTNLLLADAMARRYGKDRVAALQRCARKIRDETNDPQMEAIARQIIKLGAGQWHLVLIMVTQLAEKLTEEGVLDKEVLGEFRNTAA